MFIMTIQIDTSLTEHPFWQFSCQIYDQAKEELLHLQNRHGLNINILLFCIWFTITYHTNLSKTDIKHILTMIHIWHERIILPLRRLRDSLPRTESESWQQVLRNEILNTELSAEYIEQSLILSCVREKPIRNRKKLALQASLAYRNILTYSQILYISLDQMDFQSLSSLFQIVFPTLDSKIALNLWQVTSSGISNPKKSNCVQLELHLH